MKKIEIDEAWKIITPLCRDLEELINKGYLFFIDGEYDEKNGIYNIYLESKKIHIASRGLRDSIGDIEYYNNYLRIGFRSGGKPANVFINLLKV